MFSSRSDRRPERWHGIAVRSFQCFSVATQFKRLGDEASARSSSVRSGMSLLGRVSTWRTLTLRYLDAGGKLQYESGTRT